MSSEITKLNQRRGYVKGLLTKFKKSLDEFNSRSSLAELRVALDRNRSLMQRYEEIHLEIIAAEPEKADDHDKDLDNFIENYDKCIGRAETLLARTDTPLSSAQLTTDHPTHSVRLPEIKLQTFKGDHESWLSFRDSFTSLIDNDQRLSKIQKLHYLRSSLTGDAANVITNLATTDANYDVAWTMLREEYDNQRFIVRRHIEAIINLPTFAKDVAGRRQWLNSLKSNLRSLDILNQQSWDTLLTCLIWTKLDRDTNKSFEETLTSTNMPPWESLLQFLERQKQLSEATVARPVVPHPHQQPIYNHPRPNRGTNQTPRSQQTALLTRGLKQYAFCNEQHSAYNCETFLSKSVGERYRLVQGKQLCIKCLRGNHETKNCQIGNCKICHQPHNTLLHKDSVNTHTDNSLPATSSQLTTSQAHVQTHSLLSTAVINIVDKEQESHPCRVILDTGSQSNYMTKEFADTLNLDRKHTNITINSINDTRNTTNQYVTATLASRHSRTKITTTFLILPKITEPIPEVSFDKEMLKIPKFMKLADPAFNIRSKIDALLGVELFYRLIYSKQRKLKESHTILQASHLGWIVSGAQVAPTPGTQCNVSLDTLNNNIERFWEVEEIPNAKQYSSEEERCETHYKANVQRDNTGRYQVRLPFKGNELLLGESYNIAFKQFLSLESRLRREPASRIQYQDFLREYEALGHMTQVREPGSGGYYLPHHAVMKEASLTTKIRVVFNGSAKTSSGLALNDVIMVGPTIQSDLVSLILKFRTHKYVLTADIEKMYRQVEVHPLDRPYQRILWREQSSDRVKVYELNTVTYGLAAAPYLAIRTLHQLADDDGDSYPIAAHVLKTDFYVDDLLTGAATIQEAVNVRDGLIALLRQGGFRLRQWSSNEQKLIRSLPDNSRNEQSLFTDSVVKALGISWLPQTDSIKYKINIEPDGQPTTKRTILSVISRLFDPLGLVGPVIIEAKLIMRDLWISKCRWDSKVPDDIEHRWFQYLDELSHISNISIPRRVIYHERNVEMHGFCDASEQAYGACIYMRSTTTPANRVCHLLCAKSRVAPVKPLSLPRLELSAATLLAKLFTTCTSALNRDSIKYTLWTDSTIVLHWINTEPHRLKTFVSNRVASIQSKTKVSCWRHVPSQENPADIISRGQTPLELSNNTLWYHGPNFLQFDESHWPQSYTVIDDVPEMRVSTNLTTKPNLFHTELFNRYSSFTKLKRVLAYCLRFFHNTKTATKEVNYLKSYELRRAETSILRAVQEQGFYHELHALQQGQSSGSSALKRLAPFVDTDGLIRVGGRLRNAVAKYDTKHPILLPRNHVITTLIIKMHHEINFHSGVHATLYAVRERFWPVNGRNSVKTVLHSCMKCFRANPATPSHEMGQLPKNRVTGWRPFLNTGVDYCGPFLIKDRKYRNRGSVKVYVAIFVCFATKAVHLEVVTDLTTEAFIAAFKRFISRRGRCQNIYSDNATTFVGADRALTKELHFLKSGVHNDNLGQYLASLECTWHFIPPRSPHFGGLWEAAVKSFKGHLRRTIGDILYTLEELITYVTEIEAVLNSRPLTPLSSDPNDLLALTPAHFLIGDSLTGVPEPDLSSTPINRLNRWQLIQQAKQHLWTRWRKEYLNELHVRAKWHYPGSKVEVGTLVVLHEDNIPPLHWPLGKIIETHPGEDGVTRVVTVKTTTGIFKRSVKKISPLPIEN